MIRLTLHDSGLSLPVLKIWEESEFASPSRTTEAASRVMEKGHRFVPRGFELFESAFLMFPSLGIAL